MVRPAAAVAILVSSFVMGLPQAPHVEIENLKAGAGERAAADDRVYVTYLCALANGTVVDSNTSPTAEPFTFRLGAVEVVAGFEQGVTGMRVGGKRKVRVPAALAYGSVAIGKVPPNSDLTFDVTLLGIVKHGKEKAVQTSDLRQGTGARVVKRGDTVRVSCVGSFLNGKVFERDAGSHSFVVGAGRVPPCFESGVIGMRVGGIRKIVAPPDAAYRYYPSKVVPPLQEVVLKIKLIGIAPTTKN
ncbi:MAG TPA: FKBP-type peptidyl-prolyl cis-trans isomerase [Fimbriimonadaceae bacterium]|nr:FKBP-type peptidyl-prolyl cis-trans isomerase [Fimbriimonadaceae bacterium]